jgi:hypothetical protein
LATVRELNSSAWAMAALVRPAATSLRIDLTLGEIGKPTAGRGGQRPPGLLTSASANQRVGERAPEPVQHGPVPVPVAEVAAGAVHGDANDVPVVTRQADRHLVLDGSAGLVKLQARVTTWTG